MNLWEFIVKHWLTFFFGLISTGQGAALRVVTKRMRKDREASKAMQEGVLALLSAKLQEMSYAYHEKGYCPFWAKRTTETLYKAYHELGGNGAMTEAYQQLMELPLEKSEENKPKGV